MRRLILIILFVPTLLLAQPPIGYYDPAADLSGDQLRAALHNIIDDHSELANSALWGAFQVVDRKANGKVWDIYSDVPDGTPPYEFTFVTDQCGNYSGEGDCFNREHTFPQSWFNGAPPMDTDLFHLYPTDAWVNQRRANWPYGEVGNPEWTSMNGTELGPCNYPGCSGTVLEPIDAYKGDLARSYFYLLTRYYGSTQSWSSPMLIGGEFAPWVETMLIEWHVQDPVSPKEVARNNWIFSSFQGNRNPFIDDPRWVHAIWGPTASIDGSGRPLGSIQYADGELVIALQQREDNCWVEVLDSKGSLVATWRFSGDRATFQLEAHSGLYLVSLRTLEQRQTQRIAF